MTKPSYNPLSPQESVIRQTPKIFGVENHTDSAQKSQISRSYEAVQFTSSDSGHPQLDKPKTQTVIANVKRSQKLNNIEEKKKKTNWGETKTSWAHICNKLNDQRNNVKINGPADK